MSSAYAIVSLYLLDSLLGALLPVSRGTFVLFMLPFLWTHVDWKRRLDADWRIAGAFAMLLVAGVIGASLSNSGQTPIFFVSVLLMYLLWLGGARLRPARKLVSPAAAMFGVVVSHAFLLISLAGLDAYGLVHGLTTNRPAGLFLEPSHFGLYVTPLWLMAHHRSSYRIALYAMLIFSLAILFSLTFALALGIAIAVGIALRAPSPMGLLKDVIKFALLALLLTGPVALYDPVVFDDQPLSSYVNYRVLGLFSGTNDDPGAISSLVVLQGFEIAGASVRASAGLGVGLGNLGVSDTINSSSFYRELINRMSGHDLDLNLRDGALLLNKLIGELGVFSMVVLLAVKRQFDGVRRLPTSSAARSYHAALLAFVLTEIFVRGLPYFSAPSCLAIVSLATFFHAPGRIIVRKTRRRRRAIRQPRDFVQASKGYTPAESP